MFGRLEMSRGLVRLSKLAGQDAHAPVHFGVAAEREKVFVAREGMVEAAGSLVEFGHVHVQVVVIGGDLLGGPQVALFGAALAATVVGGGSAECLSRGTGARVRVD